MDQRDQAHLVRITTLWKGDVISVEHLAEHEAPPTRGRTVKGPFEYIVQRVEAPERRAGRAPKDPLHAGLLFAMVALSIGLTGYSGLGPSLDYRIAEALRSPTAAGVEVVGGRSLPRVIEGLYKNFDATEALAACQEKAFAQDGRVVVHFVISAEGRVQGATILRSTVRAPAVEACLVNAVRSLSFPPVAREMPTWVNFPFTFREQANC